MGFRRKAAKAQKEAEPPLPKRKGGDLKAVPWLALAAMVLLWPGKAQGVTERQIQKREKGRGRDAQSPQQIPLRGWRDILWRTVVGFNRDRISTVSGGVAFFALLAMFPGLAAFVSLYGLFADIHDVQKLISTMAGVAPRDAVAFIGTQMIRISLQRHSALSSAFIISLLLSVWSANSGVKVFIQGLNVAYGETEKRGIIGLTLYSLLFTLGALLFTLFCVGAVVAIPLILPFLQEEERWVDLVRWPVLLVGTMLVLAVAYRYGPSRQHARWRWVTWGSLVAGLLWLTASFVFSWYVANMAHYDRTYGPFGAVAGGMVWLWMSALVMLFGAELNAEIEHQTAVDSTTGPPLPLGKRGAVMADTVGKAVGG